MLKVGDKVRPINGTKTREVSAVTSYKGEVWYFKWGPYPNDPDRRWILFTPETWVIMPPDTPADHSLTWR